MRLHKIATRIAAEEDIQVCAGALEFIQTLVPGRLASPRDFTAGAIGAWVGFLVVVTVARARGRIM